MSQDETYPPVITSLPAARIPVPGVRGWVAGTRSHQVAFLVLESGSEVPEHSHGDQWGIVVSGAMELTIGGTTGRYGAGDSYSIPAGTPHRARVLGRMLAIDVFGEPQRFATEEAP